MHGGMAGIKRMKAWGRSEMLWDGGRCAFCIKNLKPTLTSVPIDSMLLPLQTWVVNVVVEKLMVRCYNLIFFLFFFFWVAFMGEKARALLPHGTPPPLLFTQMLPRVWLISWEKKTTIFLLGGGWVRERCEEESEIKSCVTKLGMRTRAYDKNLAVTTDLWKDWGKATKKPGIVALAHADFGNSQPNRRDLKEQWSVTMQLELGHWVWAHGVS